MDVVWGNCDDNGKVAMTKNVSRTRGVPESEGSSQGVEKLKHCRVPPTAATVQGGRKAWRCSPWLGGRVAGEGRGLKMPGGKAGKVIA